MAQRTFRRRELKSIIIISIYTYAQFKHNFLLLDLDYFTVGYLWRRINARNLKRVRSRPNTDINKILKHLIH